MRIQSRATAAGHIAFVPVAILLTLSASAREPGAQWPEGAGDFDPRRIAALDDAVRSGEFRQIKSVVVIRDGGLLIERYYNGADRDTTHNPRSVSKTIAGTVLGIAIAEGHIDGTEQTLADFYDLAEYDNYSEKKAGVTLHQLLTMTSGFDGFDFDPASPGNEENMYPTRDWVEWTLDLPMAADREPGAEWRYFTAGVVLLGDILNRAVPGGLEAYAHRKLFGPLGITNYEWQHTPQRVGNTAGGLQMTPLGFARFGQLYLDLGRWAEAQIVPAAWVDRSLTPHVETTVEGNRYGYLWWHKSYTVGDRKLRTAYCSGNGGNKIFVFDDPNLVVVVTASAYGQRYMHTQVDEMMEDYILPAVIE